MFSLYLPGSNRAIGKNEKMASEYLHIIFCFIVERPKKNFLFKDAKLLHREIVILI
jgi:hypothetical protein